MPDANGQFKGISIPDCAYTRSLSREPVNERLAEAIRVQQKLAHALQTMPLHKPEDDV